MPRNLEKLVGYTIIALAGAEMIHQFYNYIVVIVLVIVVMGMVIHYFKK